MRRVFLNGTLIIALYSPLFPYFSNRHRLDFLTIRFLRRNLPTLYSRDECSLSARLAMISYRYSTCLLLCLLNGASAAWGDVSTRPFWTEQAMFRFGDELFFTGRGSCAPTAEEGRQRAYESAVQEVLNYTQLPRLTGVPIETQMLFEEPNSSGCPSGTVSVWRLLRIPELMIDTLVKRARQMPRLLPPKADPILQPVRDLTLRVGMNREEIHERFGLPRAVMMRRGSREVQYEYARFGLTLTVDEDGKLLRWRLDAPQSATASRLMPLDWPSQGKDLPSKNGPNHEPPLDLTDRLRELEERTHQELKDDAKAICARRWPRNSTLQSICEPYEYEHLRIIESQGRR